MNSTPTPFIVLEDISFGMLSPCVMDIKVGVQSWDEDAPPHKAAREAAKWPLQQRLGFRFTGMYVTWPSAPSRSPLKVGTEFAYSLTPATFIDALCTFAGDDCRTSLSSQDWKLRVLPVFLSLLQQLQSLLIAVKTQHEYRVYGSSVLAAYDAAQEQPSVQLALIDFGHVWPITNEPAGVDSGLIQGIETLLLFTVSAMLQSQARAFT